jgi:hypothetical protein
MTREYVSDNFAFHFDISYWNSGTKDTIAEEVEIAPIKNVFDNDKGNGKKKELTAGKVYKGIKVMRPPISSQNPRLCKRDSTLSNDKQFWTYIIRNDNGVITKYYQKSMFIDKETLRSRKLNEIL